ncbi:50S ribosomal protein L11 methyltransferase [Dehalobacter sp. DCM]|uniref:50S ribosomal protein L11 methyltransferase n=1 Tax=Dehalobacter sp. DCM TaxID=2907827 RepID=UPI003081335B|nr:50S ribosomal protein L11 methyltransferase [Dehalobacter sp. DCM]
MNWMEIAVTVSSEGEEAVTDLFYRIGSKGVVVEAPALIQEYVESGIWDYHVFDSLELTGKCIIKGYFHEDEYLSPKLVSLREELMILKDLFPEWTVAADSVMVKEEDWANEWKRYFKPVRIGQHILIKPTWEEADPLDDDVIIEIDPGMAFGTGTHPTTVLCLEALEDLIQEGTDVFDIGTGSGILAVAAAKLGGNVQAGDIDPLAVRIARQNAALNKIEDKIKVDAGNLGEVFTGKADVVIANIIADVIIELLPSLPELMKPNGVFLASGIIDTREADVRDAMSRNNLRCIGRLEDAGWVLIKAEFN